ncbi:hypothetical protein MHBO_000419 [Bonamia ostreae]|uniref:Uncharacterized protein n=1 Tax=Bonamia ostreae TaxID=126728 RepID=A0ABV2AFN2_9EUKA
MYMSIIQKGNIYMNLVVGKNSDVEDKNAGIIIIGVYSAIFMFLCQIFCLILLKFPKYKPVEESTESVSRKPWKIWHIVTVYSHCAFIGLMLVNFLVQMSIQIINSNIKQYLDLSVKKSRYFNYCLITILSSVVLGTFLLHKLKDIIEMRWSFIFGLLLLIISFYLFDFWVTDSLAGDFALFSACILNGIGTSAGYYCIRCMLDQIIINDRKLGYERNAVLNGHQSSTTRIGYGAGTLIIGLYLKSFEPELLDPDLSAIDEAKLNEIGIRIKNVTTSFPMILLTLSVLLLLTYPLYEKKHLCKSTRPYDNQKFY